MDDVEASSLAEEEQKILRKRWKKYVQLNRIFNFQNANTASDSTDTGTVDSRGIAG